MKKPKLQGNTVSMSEMRNDSWTNALTGVGTSLDKRTYSQPVARLLSQSTLETLYDSDDVVAKLVDFIPDEMFREGYDIRCSNKEISQSLFDKATDLDLDTKLNDAMKYARLYGTSIIILGFDDGKPPFEPLDEKNLIDLRFVTVLHRYELETPTNDAIDYDISSRNYKKPLYYTIRDPYKRKTENVHNSEYTRIHHTRVIRVDGLKTPSSTRSRSSSWGQSVVARAYDQILNFNLAYDSATSLIPEVIQKTYKIENLTQLLASGKGEALNQRLRMMDFSRSILKAVVMDSKSEGLEVTTLNLSGLSEILTKIEKRLVAATGMPHTIILGESPSGLGATGDSEKRDFYDHISNQQEAVLKPVHTRIYDLILRSSSFQNKTQDPVEIEYRALWQQTENERVDIRLKQSQIDKTYIELGVLSPDEVRTSRFATGQYSMETSILPDNEPASEATE